MQPTGTIIIIINFYKLFLFFIIYYIIIIIRTWLKWYYRNKMAGKLYKIVNVILNSCHTA